MKRRKQKDEAERAEQERAAGEPQRAADCRQERIEAELAGHRPGAAGLTVRSRRSKC